MPVLHTNDWVKRHNDFICLLRCNIAHASASHPSAHVSEKVATSNYHLSTASTLGPGDLRS
jgi:hypothetical protein